MYIENEYLCLLSAYSSIKCPNIHAVLSSPPTTLTNQLIIEPDDPWTSLNRTEFTLNPRLQLVSIENNHIAALGATLSKHKRLVELQLSDNGRFDLDANDVANLVSSSLHILQLAGCRLTNITNDRTFAGLPNLRQLNLDRNQLRLIPATLLGGTNVTVLSMSGNTDFNFPADRALLHSSTLSVFRCNKCGITRIYTDTFRRMSALTSVELNDNHITLVYTLAFVSNPLLASVQLNDNQLQAYPLEAMRSPPLRELCLDGNMFNSSVATTLLKERYATYALRADCPVDAQRRRLDDVEDTRLPGISDAFIASYLVMVVMGQAALGVVLVLYCLRHAYVVPRRSRRRGSEEFDYAAGVVNDNEMYCYVR